MMVRIRWTDGKCTHVSSPMTESEAFAQIEKEKERQRELHDRTFGVWSTFEVFKRDC